MDKKKTKSKNRRLQGVSLLEMLISLFIFSLIITTIVVAFISSFHAQKKTRDIQKSLEEGRAAMELMAKTLRMSSYAEGSASEVHFYNNSQGQCLSYRFNSGYLEASGLESPSHLPIDDSSCDSPGVAYNYSKMTNVPMGGLFDIVETGVDSVGRAVIMMKIGGKDVLQTSVSFRKTLKVTDPGS